MPPQYTSPASPNPQYDFIMNSGQPAKPSRKFSAPKLPKLVLIVIGAFVLVLILAIIVGILNSAGKGDTKAYTDIISRSAEIVRVGELAKTDIKDLDTLALLTTTNTALASEQTQFAAYLASTGTSVDPKLLNGYLNSETDKGLETAKQNNNLEKTYVIYLKGSLDGYLGALKSTQTGASANAKPILAGAITSTEALLSAPQFSTQ